MRSLEIQRLLPGVFQRTLEPGRPLSALLDVMEALHAPSEAVLANLEALFNPYRTPDAFVPFLAQWVDVDLPVTTGLGCLRELVAEQGGELGIIQYCPHGPDDGCDCRKPRPGMLKRIALHYGVELAGIWFVGDSSGDLEAALAVDCQPVLVKIGCGQV